MPAFSCVIQKTELQLQSKEGNIFQAKKKKKKKEALSCNFYCNIYKMALMHAQMRRKGNFIHSVDLSASVIFPQSF